jgi:hypothetical protein
MNHYVLIAGAPSRQFYERAAASMDPALPRHKLLVSVSAIRSAASEDGNPENPNCTIVLRNDHGQATALFALPPIGARVTEYLDGAVLFSGVLSAMRFGRFVTLEVQA